jgi:hypothetical protein
MIKTMPDKIATAVGTARQAALFAGLAIAYDWFHGLDWNLIA